MLVNRDGCRHTVYWATAILISEDIEVEQDIR